MLHNLRAFWREWAMALVLSGLAITLLSSRAKADEDTPGVYFARDSLRQELTVSSSKHGRKGYDSARQEVTTSGGVPALVTAAAQRHGVPVGLAHGVIRIESGYRCSARNGRALGIGQVFAATARSVGVTGNLFDCATGLEASMRYLRLAIDMHGAGCAGASAYNTGVHVRSRCTGYGRKVMAMAVRS